MAGERFYFQDGSSVGSIEELLEKLREMSTMDFKRHVNEDKNDFAAWIEHSLERPTLASRIKMLLLKDDIEFALYEDIGYVEPPAEENVQPIKEEPKKVHEKKAPPKKEEPKHKPADEHLLDIPFKEEPHESKEPSLSISTESPHKFIIKEFILGALFGLLLGVILMAVLYQLGVFGYY